MSVVSTKDASSYQDIGTTQSYLAGAAYGGCTSNSTAAGAINTFYALPFYRARGGTIDQLRFVVGTASGAGAKGRMGVYTSTSPTNLYPNALVVDGGEFAVDSTGNKTATVSVVLAPNTLYWFAYVQSVSFSGAMQSIAGGQLFPILGIPSTFGGDLSVGLTVAQTYGALPDPFPASATVLGSTGFVPALAARFSL